MSQLSSFHFAGKQNKEQSTVWSHILERGGCKGKIASSSKIQVHVSSAGTEGKIKKGTKRREI
jgi:hypothetical protein